MSAVELALKKVKELSPKEAKALLIWLDAKDAKNPPVKKSIVKRSRKKKKAPLTMKQLKAWQDSIRLTTDWEPPRLPDEFVKPFHF